MPNTPTQITKHNLSRRIPKEFQSAARKHARQIGEVALAWNHLQDALFNLFWVFTTEGTQKNKRDRWPISHAIWHSFQSDKAQREMLLVVVKADARVPQKLRGQIKWIVDHTKKLGTFRNDAVHTPIKFALWPSGDVDTLPQAASGRTSAIERLIKAPLSGTWRRTRGDLVILAAFCHEISSPVLAGRPFPTSLQKPVLLCLLETPRRAKGRTKGPRPR